MRSVLYVLLMGCGLLLQPVIAGDNLTIPGHVPASQKQTMPRRGARMEDVLSRFGEPDERHGPVGDPPITEWVYGSFRVYFEHEIVLHAVDLNTIIMPKQ
jgi:hypothetical protein